MFEWFDPIMHITGGYIFNMCQGTIEGKFETFISRVNWIIWTLCIIWTCLSITSLILMYDRDDILEIKRIEIMINKNENYSKSSDGFEVMDDEGLRERGINTKVKHGSVSSAVYYRSYLFKEGIFDSSFLQLILMMIFSSAYLISIIFLFKPMIETGTEKDNMISKSHPFNPSMYNLTGDNVLIIVDAIASFL